jgi:DNA-binding cell septation regulator SpoVG
MIYVAESKILDIYQNMSVEQLLDILNKVEQARDNPENSHDADAKDDEDFPEMGDDEDFDETYVEGFNYPENLHDADAEDENFPEMYVNDFDYAREHGEIELYYESRKINNECARAIDEAISKHFTFTKHGGGRYVDTEKALNDVAEKFGAQRVNAVVAHIVKTYNRDGRLSQENKDWARTVETPKIDHIPLYTHLTIFNGFADKARNAQMTLAQSISPSDGRRSETALEINQNIKQEEKKMANSNITARVTPIEMENSNLKGSASVTFGDSISVHGVKIVEGKEGLFVSMPSESKNGKYYDTVKPISKEAYENLKNAVFKAYEEALIYGVQEKKTENNISPTEIALKVGNYRESAYGNNVKGLCDVTVADTLVVTGVKIVADKNGELFASLPSRQSQDGDYIPTVSTPSKEFNAQLQATVLDYYQKQQSQRVGNTPYESLGRSSKGTNDRVAERTLNSKFAEAVGEQLEADGVKWGGKVEGSKTLVAVAKADETKLEEAIGKAKDTLKEAAAAKEQTIKTPVLSTSNPTESRGGR